MQLVDDAREELEVRAGEDAQADDIDVFLERGFGDHLGGLADARVDHFAAAVAEGASDNLGAAVVAVQSGLCDEDADLLCRRGGHRYCFQYRPGPEDARAFSFAE